jgi:hypothetical protein
MLASIPDCQLIMTIRDRRRRSLPYSPQIEAFLSSLAVYPPADKINAP